MNQEIFKLILILIAIIGFGILVYIVIKIPYQDEYDEYDEYIKNKKGYNRFLKSRSDKYF